jgi:hypothetical protein
MDNEAKMTILEIEEEKTKFRLVEQIKSLRRTLDSLERKLENNEELYDSDGTQGNGLSVDSNLSKLVAYRRAISLLNKG